MNRWTFGGIAALGLGALVVGSTTCVPVSAQAEPAWQSDYAAAQELARRSGKPLFVAFR